MEGRKISRIGSYIVIYDYVSCLGCETGRGGKDEGGPEGGEERQCTESLCIVNISNIST
jgi:hypothetical protein